MPWAGVFLGRRCRPMGIFVAVHRALQPLATQTHTKSFVCVCSLQPPLLCLCYVSRRRVLPRSVSATARRTPAAGGAARCRSTCRRSSALRAGTRRPRCGDVSCDLAFTFSPAASEGPSPLLAPGRSRLGSADSRVSLFNQSAGRPRRSAAAPTVRAACGT